MKLFFWPIETSSRDFNYKLQLAKDLPLENSIHIFARPWTLAYLALVNSKINWIGQNVSHKFRWSGIRLSKIIKNKGGRIFYFDEEGGFYYPAELAEEVFAHRYRELDQTDIFHVFTWGKIQNIILTKLGFSCTDVGHPRFDKLAWGSNSNVLKREVLIMTNFSLILSEKNFSSEFDDNYFPKRKLETIRDFSNLIKFISDNQDLELLIRPHPSEDLLIYQKLFRHLDNVKILEREPLHTSLQRAAKVYHFNCTTALDAFSSGIETHNLSDGKSTIIQDLPTDREKDIKSDWLSYPSKRKGISDVILTGAIDTNPGFKFWQFYIMLNLIEVFYSVRKLIKGNYETEKFGDMKSLTNGKNFYIYKK